MQVRRAPADRLRRCIRGYWGFEETTSGPTRRREGPGGSVVIILSFGHEWLIDGQRRESFIGGLRMSQVTTEHSGHSYGVHIDIAPWAAYALFARPMHELAETTVAADELLPGDLAERLAIAPTWGERFEMLDRFFARRLLDEAGSTAAPEVIWAWERMQATQGSVRISALTEELGWSKRRLIARFRAQIGLRPKAAARLLRFDRARSLAGSMSWGRLAFVCGYSDQPHLIAEFQRFTGRTPAAFLEDAAAETRTPRAADAG